jgi:glycosyltransferase involved in cell wall biosynthesis
MHDTATISIVIPAYNEASHIGSSFDEVMAYVADHPRITEVIVVDDGSIDDTSRIVSDRMDAHESATASLKLLGHGHNRGKGAAVRSGFLDAGGDIVVFTDADLSSPIDALLSLVDPIIEGQCDISVASRALDRSLIDVHQTWFRETAGKIFNVMVRGITGLPVHDTQCGFKAFDRLAVRPVFDQQQIETFAFDVEILYLARKRGLRILEIPLPWSHVEHTKVRMARDSARMFTDVRRRRWNDLRGRYK